MNALRKILLILAALYILSLLVFPVAIFFDSANTKTLSLSLSRTGIPKEEYKYLLVLSGTNWPITTDILPDPKNPNIVYQATDKGVFKTENNAESWQESSKGLPDKEYMPLKKEVASVNRLKFDPEDSSKIYADVSQISSHQYYLSSNSGVSWEQTNKKIFQPLSSIMAPNRQTILDKKALTQDPTDKSVMYKVESEKIYKSVDRGNTWTVIYGSKIKDAIKDNPIFFPAFFSYFMLAWISPSGVLLNYTGVGFDRYFTTPLVFSYQNPGVVYVGSSGGVLKGKLQH